MPVSRPGYGAYAPRPGRNSTFFNNPYMGQIANNLSSAIYGNPADELTRENIKNAQFDRSRQMEQDELKAAELALSQQQQQSLGASLMEAYSGPEEGRQQGLVGAYAKYVEGGGDPIKGQSMLASFSPKHQNDLSSILARGDQGVRQIGASGDEQRRTDTDRYWNDVSLNQIKQDYGVTNAETAHEYDKELLDIKNIFTTSERKGTQTYDSAEDLLGRQGDALNKLISENLWSDELSGQSLQMPAEDISVLPGGAADPAGNQYGGVGGGGGTPLNVSASGEDKARTLQNEDLVNLYGEDAAANMDPALKTALSKRTAELYQQSRNWPTAAAQARKEILADEASEDTAFWSNNSAIVERGPEQTPGTDLPGSNAAGNDQLSGALTAGTPSVPGQQITGGPFKGHTKGDDGKIYDSQGTAVARWR